MKCVLNCNFFACQLPVVFIRWIIQCNLFFQYIFRVQEWKLQIIELFAIETFYSVSIYLFISNNNLHKVEGAIEWYLSIRVTFSAVVYLGGQCDIVAITTSAIHRMNVKIWQRRGLTGGAQTMVIASTNT